MKLCEEVFLSFFFLLNYHLSRYISYVFVLHFYGEMDPVTFAHLKKYIFLDTLTFLCV